MLVRKIPGVGVLELEHLLLDLNGTISVWGRIAPGLQERLPVLARELQVHLLSADTYGTLDAIAAELGVSPLVVVNGADKLDQVLTLGADTCVAIGNGVNDAKMLAAARVGIAVVGPEGAAVPALTAADVVCHSILDALDLLIDESGLAATLRP